MKNVFVVVGELEDGRIDTFYGIVRTIDRAEQLCLEAEEIDSTHKYTWYVVVEEDD